MIFVVGLTRILSSGRAGEKEKKLLRANGFECYELAEMSRPLPKVLNRFLNVSLGTPIALNLFPSS